jgi:hypothetical protein
MRVIRERELASNASLDEVDFKYPAGAIPTRGLARILRRARLAARHVDYRFELGCLGLDRSLVAINHVTFLSRRRYGVVISYNLYCGTKA